jgi:hypothetical protein
MCGGASRRPGRPWVRYPGCRRDRPDGVVELSLELYVATERRKLRDFGGGTDATAAARARRKGKEPHKAPKMGRPGGRRLKRPSATTLFCGEQATALCPNVQALRAICLGRVCRDPRLDV